MGGLVSTTRKNYKGNNIFSDNGMALPHSDPPHGDQSGRNDVPTDQSAATTSRSISMHGNRFDSRDIFQASREVIIAHGDEIYRLRLTAQNKLILTK